MEKHRKKRLGKAPAGMEDILMLELSDVSLRFFHEKKKLLSSISLNVHKGSCVGLTGPSGGGKTLIGLIAAGVIPELIKAEIGGAIHRFTKKETHRTSSAIVFQDPSFQLLSNTVYDELLFTPRKLGWPDSEIEKDINEIVAGLDIEHLLNRNPRELSMGEVQRVAAGVALMQRPRIIVLDEPTQYLDRFHVEKTLEFVCEWAKRHRSSILLIEHHISLLNRFCNSTFIVENGTVTKTGLSEPVYPSNGLPAQHGTGPCITLSNVNFSYKQGKPVIKGITASISCGESVALLGPNGSGKSTLAKLICGLYKPVSGTIMLFNKKQTKAPQFRDIGYVMQEPDRQIFASTVFEECSFGPRNFDIPRNEYELSIPEYLSDFQIKGFEDRDPLSLSYGEKRRMNIIGVLAYNPSLIILDEPTSGLDHKNCLVLLEHLKRWIARGKTVIVITHDIMFAKAACHRAIFIDKGRIVRDTSLKGVCEEDVHPLYSKR